MTTSIVAPLVARRVRIRGVVQGVGFRPHVFRLAHAHALAGWVSNDSNGVLIHIEGREDAVDAFVDALLANPPAAARIASCVADPAAAAGLASFEIRESVVGDRRTARISPDLPVCDECLREIADRFDRRYAYPYTNCTNCGPRFSLILALPYDRAATTMANWPLCRKCAAEYQDPCDRRFHAQPVACAQCGPGYRLVEGGVERAGREAILAAARLLSSGRIVAIKGIGGYHLACDADNAGSVGTLRERKYRKEQAFAVMVRDQTVAARTCQLSADACELLESPARPIVLARAAADLPGVAPDTTDIGIMLPYTPLHHLLFEAGCPVRLVMTSGNRSSEPTAYEDADAFARLSGLADAFLIGERPIARRVDDSVVRVGPLGPAILRRSRGYVPGAVASLPTKRPILAVGGDLKNAITLVVDGQAFVSQHIGDLSHHSSRRALETAVADLTSMYDIQLSGLVVVHDAHPGYVSSLYATSLGAGLKIPVQHHHAHVASVLAERGAFDTRVVGVAFDGTGYGLDGSIWGGEIFVGSVRGGFDRSTHLRQAMLVGGDAAARFPVQAAAGFLDQLDSLPDLTAPPFLFDRRFEQAVAVLKSGVRSFATTSVGRLFDTVAALLGFTRAVTFEGQAAMWVEQLAMRADDDFDLEWETSELELDWRPALARLVDARMRGIRPATLARAFHRGLAHATALRAVELAERHGCDRIVLSGGVMQNSLLVADIKQAVDRSGASLWANREVPANDGGLSLGQAALALRYLDAL
jgi:hydrogenase maturation protein HypF